MEKKVEHVENLTYDNQVIEISIWRAMESLEIPAYCADVKIKNIEDLSVMYDSMTSVKVENQKKYSSIEDAIKSLKKAIGLE
jgi:hypothetical protein